MVFLLIFSSLGLSKLSTITIGDFSFEKNRVFRLSDLQSLTEITIGNCCFYDLPALTIDDLPDLNSITVGEKAFFSTKTVTLEDLPKLVSFTTSPSSFFETSKMYILYVPFKKGKYTHGKAETPSQSPAFCSLDSNNIELAYEDCNLLCCLVERFPVISKLKDDISKHLLK